MSGIASVKVDAGNCPASAPETCLLYSRPCHLTSGPTHWWPGPDRGDTVRGTAAQFS